jgi:hypothetical protein
LKLWTFIFFPNQVFLEHEKKYLIALKSSFQWCIVPIGDDLTPALKGLMIENQIGIDFSFNHNSCISCLNG